MAPHPTRLSVLSRNPDKDERPWCYVVKDSALSWEYCRLAACGARSLLPSHRGHSSLSCGPPHPTPMPGLLSLDDHYSILEMGKLRLTGVELVQGPAEGWHQGSEQASRSPGLLGGSCLA